MRLQEEVLDKVTQKVWAIEPYKLFRTLIDEDLWEGGTIAATDMFNEEYLFNPRVMLVAHYYEQETGEKLE